MSEFVFSDPHFDSERIIVFGKRPFQSVAEMNYTLIQNYNSVVSKNDVCWWLGDVMFGATKDKVKNILSQLRGRKFLIMGNHDRGHSVNWWLGAGFERVFDHPVYDAGRFILLSHEPLVEFGNLPNIMNYHGHIHIQDYDFANHKHCKNVSVEETGYKPVPLVNPLIKSPRIFTR